MEPLHHEAAPDRRLGDKQAIDVELVTLKCVTTVTGVVIPSSMVTPMAYEPAPVLAKSRRIDTPVPPVSGTGQGVPTGITFNLGASPTSTDFLVAGAGTAARFLWATEDGGIAAWAGGASATIKFAATDGAVYKGLAMAGDGGSHFRIYAADFHNGKIDVIDFNFAKTTVPGGFADPTIPAGFKPFNILNIQGDLYVAYALKEEDEDDEVAGPGLGLAWAPISSYGDFSNALLVGNFGDGTINAYDLKNSTFAGQLRTTQGQVLKIDGLWGIAFGNGFQQQPTDTLFFAAGPDEETHGLYGKIEPAD